MVAGYNDTVAGNSRFKRAQCNLLGARADLHPHNKSFMKTLIYYVFILWRSKLHRRAF